MLDLARIAPGSRVLDIAAGAGAQTLLAAKRVGPEGSVTAIDIAPAMLARAEAALRDAGFSNVECRVADAESLDLTLDSFDAAICRLGLMFMSDLPAALAGIRRTLRPGGAFATMAVSSPEKNPQSSLGYAVVRRKGRLPSLSEQIPTVYALSGPGRLENAFEEAGFREVAVQYVQTHRVDPSSADVLAMMKSTLVSLHREMEPLTGSERVRAWREIETELRAFDTPDGFHTYGEMLLVAGVK